jgi:hypothetical protein
MKAQDLAYVAAAAAAAWALWRLYRAVNPAPVATLAAGQVVRAPTVPAGLLTGDPLAGLGLGFGQTFDLSDSLLFGAP